MESVVIESGSVAAQSLGTGPSSPAWPGRPAGGGRRAISSVHARVAAAVLTMPSGPSRGGRPGKDSRRVVISLPRQNHQVSLAATGELSIGTAALRTGDSP